MYIVGQIAITGLFNVMHHTVVETVDHSWFYEIIELRAFLNV